VNHLKVRSCLIDGEVMCCDERGLATGEITLGRSLVASFANRLLGELSRLRSSASRASLVHVRAMSSRMSRTRGVEARSANH
jgi:hypothetical protein